MDNKGTAFNDSEEEIVSTLRQVVLKQESFLLFLQKWKIPPTQKLMTALEQINSDLPKDTQKSFMLKQIIPNMMLLDIDNLIRDILIDMALMMCNFVSVSELSSTEYDEFIKDIYSKYIPNISKLRDSNYQNWHKLWIFLVRFCAKKIHQSMDLTNRLLRIVEYAFRTSSPEQRLRGYDCWKALIDNASLDPQHICSAKQIKLLVTPLKAKFSKQEVVISKRFDVFVHLLRKLQNASVLCLSEFLEFCFGVTAFDMDSSRSGQAKSIPQIWPKSTKVLLSILGHSHEENNECLEQIFKNPVLNKGNFQTHHAIIINSVAECCTLLKDGNFDFNRDTVIRCMWKSLFNFILSATELHKVMYNNIIINILDGYIKLAKDCTYYKSLLTLIFTSLMEFDKDMLHDSIPQLLKQLTTVFLEVNIESEDMKEYFKQVVTHSFSNVILEEEKVNMIKTLLDCLVSIQIGEHNSTNFSKIWTLAANELTIDFSVERLTEFSKLNEFFLWPSHNMQHLDGQDKKQITIYWMKLYRKLTNDSDVKKIEFIKDLEKDFKNNPLLSSNTTSLLNVISQFETKFSKEFVTKLMEVVSSVLQLPNLNADDEQKLASLVMQYFESSLDCFSSDNNEELVKLLCTCIEHILRIHSDFKLIDTFVVFYKTCTANLQSQFSFHLKNILVELMEKEIDSNSYASKEMSKCLVLFNDGVKEKEDEKKTFIIPTGRSARIARMGKDSPTSPHKPATLRLFGKDIETMSPFKIKGSQLNNTPVSKKKNVVNVVKVNKKETKPINEENSLDFVPINSEVKLQVNKLNDHQKEKLKTRRDDIPALYQDLSQSMSQDIFSSKSNSTEASQPIQPPDCAVEEKKDNEQPVSITSIPETLNSESDMFPETPRAIISDINTENVNAEAVNNETETIISVDKKIADTNLETTKDNVSDEVFKSESSEGVIKAAGIDSYSMDEEDIQGVKYFKGYARRKTIGDPDSALERRKRSELERLKMDIVGAEKFIESPRRTREKKPKKTLFNMENKNDKSGETSKSSEEKKIDTSGETCKNTEENMEDESCQTSENVEEDKKCEFLNMPDNSEEKEDNKLVQLAENTEDNVKDTQVGINENAELSEKKISENNEESIKDSSNILSQTKDKSAKIADDIQEINRVQSLKMSENIEEKIKHKSPKAERRKKDKSDKLPESTEKRKRGRPKKVHESSESEKKDKSSNMPENAEESIEKQENEKSNMFKSAEKKKKEKSPKNLEHREEKRKRRSAKMLESAEKEKKEKSPKMLENEDTQKKEKSLKVTETTEKEKKEKSPKMVESIKKEKKEKSPRALENKEQKKEETTEPENSKDTDKNELVKMVESIPQITISPTKRSVGRPRKHPLVVPLVVPNTNQSPVAAAPGTVTPSSVTPEKRKRGRPRKSPEENSRTAKIFKNLESPLTSTDILSKTPHAEATNKNDKTSLNVTPKIGNVETSHIKNLLKKLSEQYTSKEFEKPKESNEKIEKTKETTGRGRKRKIPTDDENDDIIESSQESFAEIVPLLNSSKKRPIRLTITKSGSNLESKIEDGSETENNSTNMSSLVTDTDLIHTYAMKVSDKKEDGDKDINTTQDTTLTQNSSQDSVQTEDTISKISVMTDSTLTQTGGDDGGAGTFESPESPKKPQLSDSELIMCHMDTMSVCGSKETVGDKEDEDGLASNVSLNSVEDILASTQSSESNASLSTPKKSERILTSPITAETPTRTNELLDNTMDISPITSRSNSEEISEEVPVAKSINLVLEDAFKTLDQLEMNNGNEIDADDIGETFTSKRSKDDDTFEEDNSSDDFDPADASSEAEMTPLENSENKDDEEIEQFNSAPQLEQNEEAPIQNGQVSTTINITTSKTFPEPSTIPEKESKMQHIFQTFMSPKHLLKRKVGSTSSPSTLRIKRLMNNVGQKQNVPEVIETFNEEDILTFSREIPSPLAVPQSSILKRKFADSSDNESNSPYPKRKRVNFSDPCLTSKKVFYIDDFQPSLEAKRLFDVDKKLPDEVLKDLFDFPDDTLSSEVSTETESDSGPTEPSLPVINPMALQKNKPIFPKLLDCKDDVILIVKRITSPMFVPALINKLKGRNIETIGDLAKLSESEVIRIPFKVPVVANVMKALENYHKKKEKDVEKPEAKTSSSHEVEDIHQHVETPKLDIQFELKMLLRKAIREKVPTEELTRIVLTNIDTLKLTSIGKSYNPAMAIKDLEEKDFASILKGIIDSKGISDILKRIHVTLCNDQRGQEFYDAIAEYVKYTMPLEKFFKGRSIEDLEVGVEESIKNNTFQKSDVIQHCLLPLIDKPKDLFPYLENLSAVDFDEIVINRLDAENAQSFFERILQSKSVDSLKTVTENVWAKQACTSSEIVSSFKNKIDAQSADDKKDILVEMFKFCSQNIDSNTLLELHVSFLNRISVQLKDEK